MNSYKVLKEGFKFIFDIYVYIYNICRIYVYALRMIKI